MIKHFVLANALLLAACSCLAQQVLINEPPGVSGLMEQWVRTNRANAKVEGWRVQLVSSTDRTRVEAEKVRFLRLHPDVPADWVHEKPYYKLRAGAFHTRLEAAAFLQTLHDDFPGAYPARDRNIHPRDFIPR